MTLLARLPYAAGTGARAVCGSDARADRAALALALAPAAGTCGDREHIRGRRPLRFASLPRGSRETRALADAFNLMADEVEHVVTELKEEERRKSRFVSDVSHELRTPLTAIRGAAETLLEGDVPEDDARQFLATIVRESDRLTRLANDLLTLQRIEGATGELPLRRVDLGETCRARRRGARAAHGRPRRDVVIVRARRRPCSATRPAPAGRREPRRQRIAHDALGRMRPGPPCARGRFAVLAVLDEGPGIPPEATSAPLRALLPRADEPRPLHRRRGPRPGDRAGHRDRARGIDRGREPPRGRQRVHAAAAGHRGLDGHRFRSAHHVVPQHPGVTVP